MDRKKYELQRTVGQRIKTVRIRKGITQAELAEKAELSEGHVIQVEGGFKALSVYSLSRVVEALEVSADYLLFGDTKQSTLGNIEIMLSSISTEDLVKIEELLYLVKGSFLSEN